MAPSSTAAIAPGSGPGSGPTSFPSAAANHQRRQSKPVGRTTVVPVLPLPLVRQREQQRQRRAQASVSSIVDGPATDGASKSTQAVTSPAVEKSAGLPDIASLSIAPNGTSPGITKTQDKTTPVAPVDQDKAPASKVPSTAAAVREPLAVSLNNTLPTAPSQIHDGPGNAQPGQPSHRNTRGKENIPPQANGAMMPPPQPFHPPQHPMHHPHASESSVMFGGMPDSNNTSPGPPSSGMYPPPGMHFAGQPGPGPYGQWRGPMPLSHPNGGVPGHAPAGMVNFTPSTPHSFHGSQSSNPAELGTNFEENGFHPHGQPMMNGFANGHGHLDVKNVMSMGPAASRHPSPPQRSHLMHMYQRDQQVYVQNSFNKPEDADCHIVINICPEASGRPWRGPIRLFGHRFILGFSPALRTILQRAQNGDISITVDDQYMRSDVLWACLASLYGAALPEFPEQDFSLAASYLAAGDFLRLMPITRKGVDDVVRLITNWGALEQAFKLAFSGSTYNYNANNQHADTLYKYGPASEAIMENIASYIIDNFPHTFSFDDSFPQPAYSRVPFVSTAPRGPLASPAMAEETRSSHARNSSKAHNPKLNTLKFGDMPAAAPEMEEIKTAASSGPSEVQSDNVNAILSLVLVNLPYGVLKMVMESNGLGSISGWMTTQTRYKVLSIVVAERERRRLAALEAVLSGRLGPPAAKDRLASGQPPRPGEPWDILGWREYVVGSDESPHLARNWAPKV